jgi:hypothetical protein
LDDLIEIKEEIVESEDGSGELSVAVDLAKLQRSLSDSDDNDVNEKVCTNVKVKINHVSRELVLS